MTRKFYTVVVEDDDSLLDFEAILDVGMDECSAEDNGFRVVSVRYEGEG